MRNTQRVIATRSKDQPYHNRILIPTMSIARSSACASRYWRSRRRLMRISGSKRSIRKSCPIRPETRTPRRVGTRTRSPPTCDSTVISTPLSGNLHAPVEAPDVDPKDMRRGPAAGTAWGPQRWPASALKTSWLALREARNGSVPECPLSSLVGTITSRNAMEVRFFLAPSGTFPLFNMVAPPGAPAKFGFKCSARRSR